MEGRDIQRFCGALAHNKFLKVLYIGMNKLGNVGLEYLADALSLNTALEYLDAFDVNFSNEGATYLDNAIRKNSSLKSIRLANTHVSADISESLL